METKNDATAARPPTSCSSSPFPSSHPFSLAPATCTEVAPAMSGHRARAPLPAMFPAVDLPLWLLLLLFVFVSDAGADANSSSCGGGGGGERCGGLVIPFPFQINSSSSSCGGGNGSSPAFRLSCEGQSSAAPAVVLRLGAAEFRVVEFLPSGLILLDYAYAPGAASGAAPCGAAYAGLSRPSSQAAALDAAAPFLAVTAANVLRLYDCEDSSLCRAGCDGLAAAASCGGGGGKAGCCYPLSDGGAWSPGDGLAVFAGFGCRGFSSWVKNRSSPSPSPSPAQMTRGIEVEWAVPRGSELAACAGGAATINATAVRGGVRCACAAGLVGDGFAHGTGCSKGTCGNGGGECCQGRFCSRKSVALAGFFVSVFFLAAAMSFWLFLRQPSTDAGGRWDLDPACIPKMLAGVCSARQFTYEQLDAATRRFDGGGGGGGVLDDGTLVAVQRIGYDTPEKLRQVLYRVELLPELSHRNVARVVGFCLDPGGAALLLVHEHFAGGTLEDHLRRMAGVSGGGLSWHRRVNIAVELASALTYLQAHDAAPTFLHDLRSSDVLLDGDLTAKIAGHKLFAPHHHHRHRHPPDGAAAEQEVARNFGHLLVELLTGLRHQHPLDTVAPKVRDGRLHEVLDPALLAPSSSSSSSGKLPAPGEEIRKVLELAVRCLQASGEPAMAGVARELMQVDAGSSSSSKMEGSLEETFSSSSLLQMISMSPETLHRHLP